MSLDDSDEMFSSNKSDSFPNLGSLTTKRICTAPLIYDKEKCILIKQEQNPTIDSQKLQVFFSGKSYAKPLVVKAENAPLDCDDVTKEDIMADLSSTSENDLPVLDKQSAGNFPSQISICDDLSIECKIKKETEIERMIKVEETFSNDNQMEVDQSQVQEFVRSIEEQFVNSSVKVTTSKRLKKYDDEGRESPVPSSSNGDGIVTWYSCDKCHLEFSSRKSLANHAKTHPKVMIGKNTCVYCEAKCDDPKGLSSHLFAEHLYDVSNFRCESCQVECISADSFDEHQYSCHRKEETSSLDCPTCGKVYYDDDIFTFHKAQQKQCHICCLTFCMTSQQFKVHKEKHTLSKYECEHCSAAFITKASLTKHLDSENLCGQKRKSKGLEPLVETSDTQEMFSENDDNDDEDEDSGETKTNDGDLTGSSRSQSEKTEKCLLCSAEFVHVKNLWKHVAVVHPTAIEGIDMQNLPEVKSHHCTMCDKTFTHNSNYIAHMFSHIDKTYCKKDGKAKCTICNKTFQAKRYLVDHMRLHSDDQTHVCPICSRKFLRKSHLKLHMEFHNNVKKSYACQYCEKSYVKKKDQIHHLRQKHSNLSPPETATDSVVDRGFPCSQCNKHFATALKLRMHSISHTVSKPPYTCLECSRSFPSLNTLKRHYLVHWDVRPFTCTVCSRAFRHSQSLKRHMTTHTGEKPHTCKHCGKSFSLKGTLKCHLLIHSSERAFTCFKCNASFVSKRKMKMHTCSPPSQDISSNLENSNAGETQSYAPYADPESSSAVSDRNVDGSISHILTDSLVNSPHIISNSLVNSLGPVTHFLASQSMNSINTVPGHLISDHQVRGNLVPVTSELMPVSKLDSDDVVQLAEAESTSNEAKPSEEDQVSSGTPKDENGTVGVYQDCMLLERVGDQNSPVAAYPQNDVLSQAFAVMGEDLVQDCVNLNACSVLEAKPGVSISPDAAVYTLVRLEGQDPQPTLISIPTVSESGTEENVTLQINLTDDCSEVFIIES